LAFHVKKLIIPNKFAAIKDFLIISLFFLINGFFVVFEAGSRLFWAV